ncbi:MAG TPA: MBL fold metallo-hydrolase [Solirubrobacterales bacterium]|nr:MBL fold metallo-hydrolase [Solirubrobacterales bacterium]
MELERGAAPDIHRVEDASVNWYLVEAEQGLTIVDAGVPSSWDSLQRVLGEIGPRCERGPRPRPHPRALRPLQEARIFASEQLDVPGNPQILFTPGHTLGHCALYFPDRDAVLAGDAIVMLDPYTGARGPRIVAGAATADSGRALRSLDALAAVEAGTILTGHGEPWRGGTAEAVRQARAAGAS